MTRDSNWTAPVSTDTFNIVKRLLEMDWIAQNISRPAG